MIRVFFAILLAISSLGCSTLPPNTLSRADLARDRIRTRIVREEVEKFQRTGLPLNKKGVGQILGVVNQRLESLGITSGGVYSGAGTSSATYTVTDALVIGAATTAGVRLDLESGTLAVREGDDSGGGSLFAYDLSASNALRLCASSAMTNPVAICASYGWSLRNDIQYQWSSTSTDANATRDTGLARDSAGQVKVTDGSTGIGNLRATALIVGTADTSGVRLDLESGVLAAREGDDSAYATLRAFGLDSTPSTANEGVSINYHKVGASFGASAPIVWTSAAPSGTADTGLARSSAGVVAIKEVTNNSATNIHQITASSGALSGASYSFTNALPAGAIILGVTVRVTTTITGATTFDVGDGTDVDRYGAAIALASGTTTTFASATASPLEWRSANGNVVLTANGSNFTGGVVRICVHYLTGTAPTS